MSFISKAAIIGLLTGFLGVILSALPLGFSLEEGIGLDILFKLRGERKSPLDAVIVAMDNHSSTVLNLPNRPHTWPRVLHADLTDYLANQGAAVIAFDVNFSEPRSSSTDQLFARAIQKANNVVLYEHLEKKTIPMPPTNRKTKGKVDIEYLVPPLTILAEPAVATAPFPLPKVPIKVSQYWAFKTSAGDMPTFPVTTFQVYALDVYHDFIRILNQVVPDHLLDLPATKDEIIKEKKIKSLILTLRNYVTKHPLIAEQMLERLNHPEALVDSSNKKKLQSFIKMYQGSDSPFLNFYGPPGSIPTVSYCRIIDQKNQGISKDNGIDFKNKVVFIGYSELIRPNNNDGFHTVYSQDNGVDISGVEMTATAFANLLEDMPVRHLNFISQGIVVFFWGFFLGMICYLSTGFYSVITILCCGSMYLGFILYQFEIRADWYPVVVPLFFQIFTAFFTAFVCKYCATNRERKNIRHAFGYYIPDHVVDGLVTNITQNKESHQIVYGTCLCTDAGQYTNLSETMSPEELGRVMNQYYEALFEKVKQHNGIIINIVGDSMLALWAKTSPDTFLKHQACAAALDINMAAARFSHRRKDIYFPTRIGLHHGHIMLGNVGAVGHYEYRPTGDIVNTASRMEGLNKYLGTRILVSREVMENLNDFLARDLGEFFLAGKSNPVSVYELICQRAKASDQQKKVCSIFSRALTAYREKSWEKAMNLFYQTIRFNSLDGPARFYINRIEKYRHTSNAKNLDTIVKMDRK